jgi:hypothetical protein
MKTVKCLYCKGKMTIVKIDRFNKPHGLALMSAGVLFLTAIPLEAVLGFVLLPFGAVVAFSKKEAWYCPKCSSFVDRMTPKNQKTSDKIITKIADFVNSDSGTQQAAQNTKEKDNV